MPRSPTLMRRVIAGLFLAGLGVVLFSLLPRRPMSVVRVPGRHPIVTPDASKFFTLGLETYPHGPLELHELTTGKHLGAFFPEAAPASPSLTELGLELVKFSSSSRQVISWAGRDGLLEMSTLDLDTLTERKIPNLLSYFTVNLAPNGRHALAFHEPRRTPRAVLIDLKAGQVVPCDVGDLTPARFLGGDFLLDGSVMGEVRIRDLAKPEAPVCFRVREKLFPDLMPIYARENESLSRSGDRLATISQVDGLHFRVRETTSGKVICEGETAIGKLPNDRAAFSPDASKLLLYRSAWDGPLCEFWDVETGKRLWQREEEERFFGFSNDGRQLFFTWQGNLHSVSAATGQTEWKDETPHVIRRIQPDDRNQALVVEFRDLPRNAIPIASVDRAKGVEKWSRDFVPRYASGPYREYELPAVSPEAGVIVYYYENQRVPSWMDIIYEWLKVPRAPVAKGLATVDLRTGQTAFEWERPNLVYGKLHADATVTIFSEENGEVIAERWAANPPYRWEWILGIPVALFAAFDYWRSRRNRRVLARSTA